MPNLIALLLCGSPALAPGDPFRALTVAEVYGRTTQTLTRPGLLYHATIQRELWYGAGAPPVVVTEELWVDAGRDVARAEVHAVPGGAPPGQPPPGPLVTLATATGTYMRASDGQVGGRSTATCSRKFP